MAILKTKKVWKLERPRAPKARMRPCELTAEEQENVWAAVLKLRATYPTWPALASALGINRVTLVQIKPRERPPTVGLALRIARLVGVPIDDVLGGAFAKPGCCAICGT